MKARIIDGKAIAAKILTDVRRAARHLPTPPAVASVSVGDNPSVASYIRNQKNVFADAGIIHETFALAAGVPRSELLSLISGLNANPKYTGIVVNLPLSGRFDEREIQRAVARDKDIEGMNPANLGNLISPPHKGVVYPCAPSAVIECIRSAAVSLKGKEVVIIGHSSIVGKPLAAMLLASSSSSPTVTVCHIATKNLESHTRRADVLVSAVGKAGLITREMVKEGAVVIDVGINSVQHLDDRGQKIINPKTGEPSVGIVGDVAFEEVAEIASAVTPVPGGVGPVTSAVLARNAVDLALHRMKK